MAAVTGVITTLAGLGLTAYQAYESSEQKKEADATAKSAAARLKGLSEVDKYAGIQAPDVSSLAFDRLAQSEADAVAALQGSGIEGAAQITGLTQAANESALGIAERQAAVNFERDLKVAEGSQAVEARRVARESDVAASELMGAQAASREAKANQQAAIGGLLQGSANLAGDIGYATSLESTAQRGQKKAARKNKKGLFGEEINDPYTDLDAFRDMSESLNTQ